jgi:hypothetical protein
MDGEGVDVMHEEIGSTESDRHHGHFATHCYHVATESITQQ